MVEPERTVHQSITTRRKLSRIIVESDFEPVELIFVSILSLEALVMLTHTDTFTVAPTYARMVILPEPVWGMIASMIVCLHIFGVRFWMPYLRGLSLFLHFVWWTTLGVLFWLSDAPITILNIHPLPLAVGAAWAFWRYMGTPRRPQQERRRYVRSE